MRTLHAQIGHGGATIKNAEIPDSIAEPASIVSNYRLMSLHIAHGQGAGSAADELEAILAHTESSRYTALAFRSDMTSTRRRAEESRLPRCANIDTLFDAGAFTSRAIKYRQTDHRIQPS